MKDWYLGCWFLIQKPENICNVSYLHCTLVVNICSTYSQSCCIFVKNLVSCVKVISWQNVFKVLLLWCTILLCLIFAPAAWIKCNNVIMSDDHGVISCPKSFHYNCKYSFNITATRGHTPTMAILIMTAERKLIKPSMSQCQRWQCDIWPTFLHCTVQLTYFVIDGAHVTSVASSASDMQAIWNEEHNTWRRCPLAPSPRRRPFG